MTKTLNDWMYECELHLSGQPRAARDAIIPVFQRINEIAPQLLSTDRLKSKQAFTRATRPLCLLARTDAEMDVTSFALEMLYEHHHSLNPALVAPNPTLALPPERPLFDNKTPPIGVIACMTRFLYQECPFTLGTGRDTAEHRDAAIGQALLIGAFHANLTRQVELEALLSVPEEQWAYIPGKTPLVSVYLPELKRRVYLADEAILAMHAVLRETQHWSKAQRKKRVEKVINAWKSYVLAHVQAHERQGVASLSVQEIIRYIGFLDQSAGVSHLWSRHCAVDHPTFVRTFTGVRIEYTEKRKTNVRTVKMYENVQWASVTKEWQKEKALTRDVNRILTKVLSTYKKNEPKEHRVGAAWVNTKAQLESLLRMSMPWPVALVTQWICSLFFYGSAWKDKLAVGSLLTYHSTVSRFIDIAWHDSNLIHVPGLVFEELCQAGLDNFENADEQYTIARFLRFCQQYSTFPDIDLDIFDTVTRQGSVRAHYVPPALFDEICAAFCSQGGAYERRIVVFMQLCYYIGLREDEALSLYLIEIDFNTGMIYITTRKKRKTSHAIRKIPLVLVPQSVLEQWSRFIDEQQTLQSKVPYENRLLFSDKDLSQLESQFIDFARDYLLDGTIVTHSFRHCAANNWACMLSMLAFSSSQWRTFYFTQHELFSDEHLERVRQAFLLCGHRLTPYFPVLDWVSEKLGHASPATTWSTYWHLMDWVSLTSTAQSKAITKAHVRFWTSDSNYGFERQKQLFQSSNDRSLTGKLDRLALSDWLQSQWKRGSQYDIDVRHDVPAKLGYEKASSLTFSQFVLELDKLSLGADDLHCNPDLIEWLETTQSTPVSVTLKSNQRYAWIRLCQPVDSWSSWNLTKLKRMRNHIAKVILLQQKNEITQYRDLHSLLFVFRHMNLLPLTINLSSKPDSKSGNKWEKLIKKFGAQCHTKDCTGKTHAAFRPYRLHWALWPELRGILDILTHYLNWLIAQQHD